MATERWGWQNHAVRVGSEPGLTAQRGLEGGLACLDSSARLLCSLVQSCKAEVGIRGCNERGGLIAAAQSDVSGAVCSQEIASSSPTGVWGHHPQGGHHSGGGAGHVGRDKTCDDRCICFLGRRKN